MIDWNNLKIRILSEIDMLIESLLTGFQFDAGMYVVENTPILLFREIRMNKLQMDIQFYVHEFTDLSLYIALKSFWKDNPFFTLRLNNIPISHILTIYSVDFPYEPNIRLMEQLKNKWRN